MSKFLRHYYSAYSVQLTSYLIHMTISSNHFLFADVLIPMTVSPSLILDSSCPNCYDMITSPIVTADILTPVTVSPIHIILDSRCSKDNITSIFQLADILPNSCDRINQYSCSALFCCLELFIF